VRTSFTVVACHSDWTRTTRVSTHCINAIRSVPTWSWAASIHVWKISVSDWKSWQLFEFYFFSLVSFLVLYFKTVVESRMSLHLYQYVINNVQWNKNTLNNYTLELKPLWNLNAKFAVLFFIIYVRRHYVARRLTLSTANITPSQLAFERNYDHDHGLRLKNILTVKFHCVIRCITYSQRWFMHSTLTESHKWTFCILKIISLADKKTCSRIIFSKLQNHIYWRQQWQCSGNVLLKVGMHSTIVIAASIHGFKTRSSDVNLSKFEYIF